MNVNLALKAELIKKYGSQVEASKARDIRENRLSYIIRGHVQRSERERVALERDLGRARVRRLAGDGDQKRLGQVAMNARTGVASCINTLS